MQIGRTTNGFPYSRIILSWIRAGGEKSRCHIREWLRTIDGLTEDEIQDIGEIYSWGGKFELEQSARRFIKQNGKRTLGSTV